MKKKHDLCQYSLSASAFLLLANVASGQVVYHDIEPDSIFELDLNITYEHLREWPIDLNLDGKIDFQLYLQSWNTFMGGSGSYNTVNASLLVEPYNAVMNYYYPRNYAAVVDESRFISEQQNWKSNHLIRLMEYSSGSTSGGSSSGAIFENLDGYWPNKTDQFLGLRFLDTDGQTHYGWMRLTLTWLGYQERFITVKDFAYEASANTAIQTPCIDGCPVPDESIKIFSDGSNVYVNVQDPSPDNMFTIRNIYGNIIYEGSFFVKNYVFYSNLPAGVYIVTAKHNGQEKTVKLGLIR